MPPAHKPFVCLLTLTSQAYFQKLGLQFIAPKLQAFLPSPLPAQGLDSSLSPGRSFAPKVSGNTSFLTQSLRPPVLFTSALLLGAPRSSWASHFPWKSRREETHTRDPNVSDLSASSHRPCFLGDPALWNPRPEENHGLVWLLWRPLQGPLAGAEYQTGGGTAHGLHQQWLAVSRDTQLFTSQAPTLCLSSKEQHGGPRDRLKAVSLLSPSHPSAGSALYTHFQFSQPRVFHICASNVGPQRPSFWEEALFSCTLPCASFYPKSYDLESS